MHCCLDCNRPDLRGNCSKCLHANILAVAANPALFESLDFKCNFLLAGHHLPQCPLAALCKIVAVYMSSQGALQNGCIC